MSTQEKRNLNSIPVGSLGMIPLDSCKPLGEKIDKYLVKWRTERENEHKDSLAFSGYQRDSYILKAKTPRFGSGEGKGVILESVRGYDLYIMSDVTNHNNIAAGATFENAIELVIGTDVNASIVLSGQKLYFAFVANAANINLAINGSYPKYELYSADDTATVISRSSSYGSSLKATLEGLTVGATYYVVISNSYSYEADYVVSLTEWVDPFTTAAEITADGEQKSISFEANEKKYFKFTAAETGSYAISIDNGYYNSQFTLYDADRNVVVGPLTGSYSSVTYGYITDATLELTEGTTYYILINFTGTYTTNVKITFNAPAAE